MKYNPISVTRVPHPEHDFKVPHYEIRLDTTPNYFERLFGYTEEIQHYRGYFGEFKQYPFGRRASGFVSETCALVLREAVLNMTVKPINPIGELK